MRQFVWWNEWIAKEIIILQNYEEKNMIQWFVGDEGAIVSFKIHHKNDYLSLQKICKNSKD